MPTPTGNEDLAAALVMAQQICWDETHGYTMGADMDPDTDCSGFVGYCLSHNGFNVPQRWDTTTMIPTLMNYPGFSYTTYYPGFQWQNGDIAVYDEGGGEHGHTFFYAEQVVGYTDPNGDSNATGLLAQARIEASGSREQAHPGDQAKNGTGAHWEVWVHPFSFNPNSHTWYIFRWMNPVPPGPVLGGLPWWWAMKCSINNKRKGGEVR